MDGQCKISIIVPMFNTANFLRGCLDSLVHQDMPLSDYEVILVNDGSTDDSGTIAKDYALLYENIFYYEQENQGQSVARNLGMDKAQGEYIMFVDADDYLYEDVLYRLYTKAKSEDADICIGMSHVMLKDGTIVIGRDMKKNPGRAITGRDALLNGSILGSVCARVFSKKFLLSNKAQFVPGMKHEDVYFNLSLMPSAKRVSFIDEVVYFYRWNEGSTDRSYTDASIYRGLLGDLKIANLAKELSQKYIHDSVLSKYMKRLSSSLVVSNVYSFYTSNRLLDKLLKDEYISKAQKMSLMPIAIKDLKWKTAIVAIFINMFVIDKK